MGYQEIGMHTRDLREKINYTNTGYGNPDRRPEATVSGNYIVNRFISVEDRW